MLTVFEKMKMAFNAGLHYYDDKTDEEVKEQPPTDKRTVKDGIDKVKEINSH